MFNIGPLEFVVLALVGLIVLGPDKLPSLARDAAQMLKTLREMATGARQQLRDELGPEFADVDLRNLNPRTAVTRAVFGDDFDPRSSVRDAILGPESGGMADDLRAAADPRTYFGANGSGANGAGAHSSDAPISMEKPVSKQVDPHANGRPRPRPRPAPTTDYDDAT